MKLDRPSLALPVLYTPTSNPMNHYAAIIVAAHDDGTADLVFFPPPSAAEPPVGSSVSVPQCDAGAHVAGAWEVTPELAALMELDTLWTKDAMHAELVPRPAAAPVVIAPTAPTEPAPAAPLTEAPTTAAA